MIPCLLLSPSCARCAHCAHRAKQNNRNCKHVQGRKSDLTSLNLLKEDFSIQGDRPSFAESNLTSLPTLMSKSRYLLSDNNLMTFSITTLRSLAPIIFVDRHDRASIAWVSFHVWAVIVLSIDASLGQSRLWVSGNEPKLKHLKEEIDPMFGKKSYCAPQKLYVVRHLPLPWICWSAASNLEVPFVLACTYSKKKYAWRKTRRVEVRIGKSSNFLERTSHWCRLN